jgi:ribosome-interacting GTPase 1
MSDEKEIKTLSQQLKTQREMYFHTPIFYKDIKDSAKLNEHLLKHILTWKKRDEKGINRTNSLGWHSAVDMHTKKEYDNLLRHLFDMQKEYMVYRPLWPKTS